MRDHDWKETTVELGDGHAWVARPGCKVFVLQRGAVRFDYPREWVVKPADDSIELYDKQPPDDDCRLAVSYMGIPDIDWSGLPVSAIVEHAGQADPRPLASRGDITEERRRDVELAWREVRFIDPGQQREACSLMCIARKGRVQALITFDFWVDDAERCLRIWRTVLNTLELGAEYDAQSGRIIA